MCEVVLCEWNIPSSTTNLGQRQLDAPDLTLVAETILADKLQLRVPVYQNPPVSYLSLRLEQRRAHVSVAGDGTDSRAASKGRLGTLDVLEYERLERTEMLAIARL